MKRLFALLLLFIMALIAQAQESFFQHADAFFAEHVINGRVHYEVLTENAQLASLMRQIEEMSLENASGQQQKAFYINAYNLLVIHQIVQHWPVKSPMDIPGFFKTNSFVVAGQKMTLDHLENQVLRKQFPDPRLHFVLVCGAEGCPPITGFAYTPSNLDGTMDMQTRKALNNDDFIYETEEAVFLSQIFEWYKSDFDDPVAFINTYRFDHLSDQKPVKYYEYDWSVNAFSRSGNEVTDNQLYNPGTLLKKGQIDFTVFNSIYTENQQNWQGSHLSGYRTTFASTFLQFTYGTSENARFNVGADVQLRASGTTSQDSSLGALFKPLDFQNTINSRTGIASIAPKVKWQPFKSLNDFSLQSSYIIVLPKAPEGNGIDRWWIEWDRHIWWNQFFYSKMLAGDKIQLFAEADLLFRIQRYATQGNHVDVPLSVFVSYFPNSRWTLYAMTQHTERIVQQKPTDWVIPADFTASGAGVKYQINSFMIAELLYTNFWRSRNNGLGETFNLGIKYIR